MPKYEEIKPFTKHAGWRCTVGWGYLEEQLANFAEYRVDMDPDFQRAHVWNEQQQIRYVEYILRDGMSGRDIYWNSATWHKMRDPLDPLVLVDGKQRLEAVRRFLRSEIPAFGHLRSEYDHKNPPMHCYFTFHVNDLKTRAEVLTWYLEFNSGGVVHTEEELERVRELLRREKTG